MPGRAKAPIVSMLSCSFISYNNRISSVSPMKTLQNTQPEVKKETEPSQQLQKRLSQLRQTNNQKETMINMLGEEVKGMEAVNQELREQLAKQEVEWEGLRQKQQEKSEEDEMEMNEWIQNVQKANGFSQQAIDSLLTVGFEGTQSQICPACFQQLQPGSMCTYLPCAHLFHQDCIVNHLRVNRFCLACQEPVQL